MSIEAVGWVFKHAPKWLTPNERFVLVVIANHVGESTQEAWPSNRKIMEVTGLSRPTVQRAMRVLRDAKIIRADFNRAPVYGKYADREDKRANLLHWQPEYASPVRPGGDRRTLRGKTVLGPEEAADSPSVIALHDLSYEAIQEAVAIAEAAQAGHHGDASSVDDDLQAGHHTEHGASHDTSPGHHGDAQTKNLNHQVQPGGSATYATPDRAREPVDNVRGAAAARAALAAALANRPAEDVAS